MSKVFITSDTFFGREQIIKKAKRPFETVEEMNKKLVDNWNNVVSENDTVYHLGNFAWNPIIADNILKQLNGNIIFILGEYDDALLDISEYYEGVSIIEEQIVKVKEHKAIFSHWPLEEWPGKNKGIFHFHGSTLKKLKTDLGKMNRVNVCCDNWNYTPQDIDSLYSIFEDWKKAQKEK
jgi:calcineurin-like phosphoesterase family protein